MSSSSAPMMAEAVIVHEDSEASDISDHRKVNAVPVGTTAKSLSKAGKGEKGSLRAHWTRVVCQCRGVDETFVR